jgi:hypothetical protein
MIKIPKTDINPKNKFIISKRFFKIKGSNIAEKKPDADIQTTPTDAFAYLMLP